MSFGAVVLYVSIGFDFEMLRRLMRSERPMLWLPVLRNPSESERRLLLSRCSRIHQWKHGVTLLRR